MDFHASEVAAILGVSESIVRQFSRDMREGELDFGLIKKRIEEYREEANRKESEERNERAYEEQGSKYSLSYNRRLPL